MTAELEYSFIDVVSDLRIAQELMTRAVRVKQVVRDKLSRVYLKNLVAPVVNNVQTQEVENKEVSNVVENTEIETKVEEEVKPSLGDLVDLSEENLKLLNSKLDALQSQQKVSTVFRRAVLFTNNLISKIKNVSSKWFTNEISVAPVNQEVPAITPVVEPAVVPTEPVAAPSVDLPKVEFTNHLGGEVIPGTWDDMPEKVESPVVEPVTIPNIEPVNQEVPAVTPVAEPAVVPTEPVVPTIELTPVQEETATLPSLEPVNVEEPVAIPELNSVPEVQNIVPEPASIPEIENTTEVKEQSENAIPEIKLPDLDTKEREVPDFMPKLFSKTKSKEPEEESAPVAEPAAEPAVEQNAEPASQEVPAPEPVAEPQEIDNSEFVPEPAEISGTPVEMPTEEKEESAPVEETPAEEEPKADEEVPTEEEVEPEVKAEEEPAMSIEDRIAELLNRKKEEGSEEVEPEEQPTEEAPAEEETEVDEEVPTEEEVEPEKEEEPTPEPEEEKAEISQATIIAKLQRFSNSMKEKDAEIKNLREKNQKLSDDNASIKDKMNDYDTVLKDLTNKNNDLVAENEKLSNKNSKIEDKYKDKVESLENQVEELTKAKKEEIESSKNAITEIKTKYENEIEELKKKFADDLKKANESNDRKIQAIYNTISETLGDSYSEDQGKSL